MDDFTTKPDDGKNPTFEEESKNPPVQEESQSNHGLGQDPFTHVVDDSHKYVTVYHDGYVGPGDAHHHYAIKTKEGKTLMVINFQDGPILESGVNGIMNEDLIAIVIDRLIGFQSGKYNCPENGYALGFFKQGLEALQERTKRRENRGVEGTHNV